jgi:nitrate/nitrite transport system substrate-binding protein
MTVSKQLAPPEKEQLTIGFMRLTDSAPLVLAHEAGIFRRYGLDVSLVREVSWANLRDKLVVGKLDAAHLLAPLPMMAGFGAGGMRVNLLTGLSLGLNGNAVTVANAIGQHLGIGEGMPDALGAAERLRDYLLDGKRTLTLATVHAFSMHTLLLRMWLEAGGIDPDRDVRIIVLPPEQMCDSLARGIVDGFCVGEPWNSLAVQRGVGSVAASGYQIWNNAPEKVLGVTEAWHSRNPSTHLRLRLAVMEACRQLAEPDQRQGAVEILSRPQYLDLPGRLLAPSLTGEFMFAKGTAPVSMPEFHVFGRFEAGFPWRSHAEWMVRKSSQPLGKPISDDNCRLLVQQSYRTDLYRDAARHLNIPAPARDFKEEGEHAAPWEMEPGICLGADLMVGGGRFVPRGR